MATLVQLKPPEQAVRSGGTAALYLAVVRGAFRRYSTYRAATLAGAVTNTVFGCLMAYTFIALWKARPGLGGYDLQQAVTYIWLGQALLATVAIMGGGFEDDVQERFRSGDIVIDFYRPVDFQAWWLAGDLGRAGYQLLTRGGAPMLAGALLFHARMPGDPLVWAAFALAVLLAVVVSYGLRFLVALTGFWLHDSAGIKTSMAVVSMFCSGFLVPLTLFPHWLARLLAVLPWSAVIQVPDDIFLERRTGPAVLTGLGFQLAWALALLAAGRLCQLFAVRKVVVQGG